MKINTTGLINNAQYIAGLVIGKTILKFTGLRFDKCHRGTRWFSTVSANLAADGVNMPIAPYKVII